MNITEAKSVLEDVESSFTEKYAAVRAIVDSESATAADLIDCLDVEGVSAELAAMKLHMLTGRARDNAALGVYLDRSSWEQYLSHQ